MTEEPPIDIHQYTRALRRALWPIVGVALAAAVCAMFLSSLLPKTYTASTTVLARDTLSSSQSSDVNTLTRRLSTVDLLARTTQVLSRAARQLRGTTIDDLRATVHSSVDPDANVITVTATTDEPGPAAERANAVAAALISTERRIELQFISDARREALAEISRLRASGSSNAQIQAAEGRLNALTAAAVGSTSRFRILQPAQVPSQASSPHLRFRGIVAFLVTALVGMLIVLAREQLSPRVPSTGGLDQLLGMPVVSSIPFASRTNARDLARQPPAVRDAFHALASAWRSDARARGMRIVVTTSAHRHDGRTAVAANLARALSASGASVLAVSGDLRWPKLHEWLGASRSPGLTDLLVRARDSAKLLDVADGQANMSSQAIERAIHPAQGSNARTLDIVPSGVEVDDPAELLFGDALAKVFTGIRALNYDFVVVDGPPAFGVPDLQALAQHADAVLVVVRPDRLATRQAAELRDHLDTFDVVKWGIAVVGREPHPITWRGRDHEIQTRAERPAEGRGVVELR